MDGFKKASTFLHKLFGGQARSSPSSKWFAADDSLATSREAPSSLSRRRHTVHGTSESQPFDSHSYRPRCTQKRPKRYNHHKKQKELKETIKIEQEREVKNERSETVSGVARLGDQDLMAQALHNSPSFSVVPSTPSHKPPAYRPDESFETILPIKSAKNSHDKKKYNTNKPGLHFKFPKNTDVDALAKSFDEVTTKEVDKTGHDRRSSLHDTRGGGMVESVVVCKDELPDSKKGKKVMKGTTDHTCKYTTKQSKATKNRSRFRKKEAQKSLQKHASLSKPAHKASEHSTSSWKQLDFPTTPETLLEHHKHQKILDSTEEWLVVELNEYECLIDGLEVIKIIACHSKFFEVEPAELWSEFFEFVEDIPSYDEVINFDVWQEFRDKRYTC